MDLAEMVQGLQALSIGGIDFLRTLVLERPKRQFSPATQLALSLKHLNEAEWESRFAAPDLDATLRAGAPLAQEDAAWGQHSETFAEVVRVLRAADGAGRLCDVVLAGSVAKNTAVSPKTADLDLVAMFRDFEPRCDYAELLAWIEKTLEASDIQAELSERQFYIPGVGGIRRWVGPETAVEVGRCSYLQEAPFMMREAAYIHLEPEVGPSVDILVGGDVSADPWRPENRDIWGLMAASTNRRGVDYVRRRPAHVRCAIRALKTWRDALGIKSKKFKPSSFLLELLCVWAADKGGARDPRAVFVGALELLALPKDELCLVSYEEYTEAAVPPETLRQRPLVLDPIKPWNNVVREDNLKRVRRHAALALEALAAP
ncbi:hypothetical protein M885DRAFT_510085 [Pelagophyceae sp. CCMP2097]|nr:hypothetical protein M885DRAFT_510085 [Pelagophyceae sp. CCMP2097]